MRNVHYAPSTGRTTEYPELSKPREESPLPTVIVPSSERVALAWLATLPNVTSSMVASILPSDPTTWQSTGFLTAQIAGGTPAVDIPTRRPLVQVNAWCVRPGAQRPPWGQADSLIEQVMAGCVGSKVGRTLDVTVTAGSNTAQVRVLAAWAVGEPRRLYSDDSSYAHKSVDLRLDWV